MLHLICFLFFLFPFFLIYIYIYFTFYFVFFHFLSSTVNTFRRSNRALRSSKVEPYIYVLSHPFPDKFTGKCRYRPACLLGRAISPPTPPHGPMKSSLARVNFHFMFHHSIFWSHTPSEKPLNLWSMGCGFWVIDNLIVYDVWQRRCVGGWGRRWRWRRYR